MTFRAPLAMELPAALSIGNAFRTDSASILSIKSSADIRVLIGHGSQTAVQISAHPVRQLAVSLELTQGIFLLST